MLLHSRQSSGEHRPVDINTLVDESLNLAYHGARAEKQGFMITVERSFDPAAGEVDLFPQKITRVLLNLISNGSLPQRSAKRRQIVATTNRHLLPRPRIWVTASKSESATTAPVSRRRRRRSCLIHSLRPSLSVKERAGPVHQSRHHRQATWRVY